MARSSGVLAVVVALVVLGQVLLEAGQLFVGMARSPMSARHLPRALLRAEGEAEGEQELTEEQKAELEAQKAEAKARRRLQRNGIDLDGDKLDNLDDWYAETIAGKGGKPTGFMRDLVLRSYFGTFGKSKYLIRSREFTGPNKQPCETDYETAYEFFKKTVKEGQMYQGKDDKKGWTWLVAGQSPGGLFLYLMKSPPYGERPLALIKNSNPDEFFQKVDWQRLYIRLHKMQLWGGQATTFPYPVGKKGAQRFISA